MMVAEREDARKSYQRALRVVGRYLDSEPAYHMSIAETGEGFTVRAHTTPRRADERVKQFAWDRIEDEDLFYSAAGRGLDSPKRRPQETWWPFPCRHEVALRKLGSILDDEGASSLSVDEQDEGLDVSFMRPTSDSDTLDKVQRVFTAADLCP